MRARGIIGLLLALGVLTGVAPTAQAADARWTPATRRRHG